MIEIYHAARSRSNRVIWLAEEMGIPYQPHVIPLFNKPPIIAQHNPAGTVPLMIDGDVILFESVTIMEYMTDTYGPTNLVLTRDEPGYWDYRQMVTFGEATLAAPLNAIVGTAFTAKGDERTNITTSIIQNSFRKRLGVLAKRLHSNDYVAGGRFTIADISAVYGIVLGLKTEALGLKDDIAEDLITYAQRLIYRPAYQRMLQVK